MGDYSHQFPVPQGPETIGPADSGGAASRALVDGGRFASSLCINREALPEQEKRIFTVELLRRAAPFDSGPLDDGETILAADQLFRKLEAGEITPSRGEV